jgi:Flp pilus assembly pilin Flp
LRNENGATSIEYAIMAAGIAVMIVTAVTTLGQTVMVSLFDRIAAATAP